MLRRVRRSAFDAVAVCASQGDSAMIYYIHSAAFREFLTSLQSVRVHAESECVVTVEAVEKHDDGCVSIKFQDDRCAQSWIKRCDIPPSLEGVPALHVESAAAAWYIGHVFGATHEQWQQKVHGICVVLGPFDDVLKMYPGGVPTVMPEFVRASNKSRLVETGDENITMDIATAKCEKECGSKERQKQYKQKKMRLSVDNTSTECSVCLTHPASYKWASCTHQTDGPALVCDRCRNDILGAAMLLMGTTKKHHICTPCVICRQASPMVRFTKTCKY